MIAPTTPAKDVLPRHGLRPSLRKRGGAADRERGARCSGQDNKEGDRRAR